MNEYCTIGCLDVFDHRFFSDLEKVDHFYQGFQMNLLQEAKRGILPAEIELLDKSEHFLIGDAIVLLVSEGLICLWQS